MKPKLYTFGNSTLSISEWARRMGMNHWTLRSRLRRGWELSDALLTPVGVRINRKANLAAIFMESFAA